MADFGTIFLSCCS